MAIRISKLAKADLRSLFLDSIDKFGPAQAEKYIAQLERSFGALSDNPKMARIREEFDMPVRVHPSQQHVIVYTILDDGKTVRILRVRHHSEDWTESP